LSNELQTDWYSKFIEELRLHTEVKIVEAKHYLGKRILEEKEKLTHLHGLGFVDAIAKDINVSRRDIYRCIQFVQKYPQLCQTVTQRSWNYICNKELPKPKQLSYQPPPLPKNKYEVIYADPPWLYDTPQSTKEVQAHYPVLTLQQLCWMGEEVQDRTAPNCVLYMWATTGRLDWAFPVMRAWGFKYLTSMIWDKVKHNLGWYCAANHELLLIGGKGSSRPQDSKLANNIDSVQTIPKTTRHSEKPEKFREIIESLYSSSKKLLMFWPEDKLRPPNWDIYPERNKP